METCLEKNLDLWSRSHPKEAVILNHLQVTKQIDPEDLTGWFSNLNLENIDLLFVYGVGLGEPFLECLPWLAKNAQHRLIFLEDDLEVIYRLFEHPLATKLLSHPQVELIFFRDLKHGRQELLNTFWEYFKRKFTVTALPSCMESQNFSDLNHEIHFSISQLQGYVQEYLNYGVTFFRNFYPNLLKLPKSHFGNSLFGTFKNIPAIICGAGPSLKSSMPHLTNLKDRALLFAGGSALNALHSHQIEPHFGAAIDPNPWQYQRLKGLGNFKMPTFYRSRLYHEALDVIQGDKLYVTGSGGYDIAEYVEEKLGIKTEALEEGHNVINFAVQLALRLGCNPIIFVGMDLAYTGMKQYAPGVVDDETVKEEEILGSHDLNTQAVLRKDIHGKQVYTLWKWIAESEWISDFAKEHPEVEFINASMDGIGFKDVENRSLDTIEFGAPHHFKQHQAKPMRVTDEQIRALMVDLKKSLERCCRHLQVMIDELENESSGSAALAEVELSCEDGFAAVLSTFNLVMSKCMQGDIKKVKDGDRRKKTVELGKKKYQFLQDAARANIALIDSSLKGEVLN